MSTLFEDKSIALARQNSWTFARAQGFVAGEDHRRRGMTPSRYVLAATDEFSLGFRAGYFEQRTRARAPVRSKRPT
jgi:hypothetical protein